MSGESMNFIKGTMFLGGDPPKNTGQSFPYQLEVNGEIVSSGGWVQADAAQICNSTHDGAFVTRCWESLPTLRPHHMEALLKLVPRSWDKKVKEDERGASEAEDGSTAASVAWETGLGFVAQEVE